MKSRICRVKSQRKIIAYNFSESEQDIFKASLNNTEIVFVGQESLDRKIGEIAGIPVSKSVSSKTNETVNEKAIVFCGYNGNEIWTELDKIKNLDIPLKAMLTANNKDWSLGAALCELMKEHNSFKNAENTKEANGND